MTKLDLLLRGGSVIDGTGAPAIRANVGITAGRIAYVGPDTPIAERTIDVAGKYVAPGFIDTHTHYDAQIIWDPWIQPHTQHGVTTFICGNCGFSLAPSTPKSLSYLVPMLAKVEGIPYKSLLEGGNITWTTTGEMLASLDGKVGVNIGFMTGHSALRAHVMGDRARTDKATPADIDAMKDLLRQSLSEGALGFSSSHIETHLDHEAIGVPSLHASREELLELMSVVKDYEGTITGYVLTGRNPSADDKKFMAEVSLASNRVFCWPLLAPGLMADEVVESKLNATDVARSMGAELRVQSPSCPINNYSNFKSGLGYDQFPGLWNEVYRKDNAGRIAAFSDAQTRKVLETDALKLPKGDNSEFYRKWGEFRIVSVKSEKNKPFVGRDIAEIARELGKSPFDTILDIVVEDELDTVFLPKMVHDELTIWKGIVACMRDDRTVWGGDDGGAHLDALEAYSHGTRFIENAVRKYGLMPLEEAVHHFTQVQAQFTGLTDRGVVAEGMYADLIVIDYEKIAVTPTEMRADFPAGGERLFTGAVGFDYVIVNGIPIIENAEYTKALPGTVLRAREHTYTVDITKGAAITDAPKLRAVG